MTGVPISVACVLNTALRETVRAQQAMQLTADELVLAPLQRGDHSMRSPACSARLDQLFDLQLGQRRR